MMEPGEIAAPTPWWVGPRRGSGWRDARGVDSESNLQLAFPNELTLITDMVKWGDIELPGFDRPLRPVGAKRRRIFAAFLEGLLAEVSSPRARAGEAPKQKPETTMFADACRACRGHCCAKGGNDAYLDENAIRQAWARHPRLSRRGLMQRYLDAIPEKAFANSCIFHAEQGCSLPRSLRAPVSGAYLCGPLERLAKAQSHPSSIG